MRQGLADVEREKAGLVYLIGLEALASKDATLIIANIAFATNPERCVA